MYTPFYNKCVVSINRNHCEKYMKATLNDITVVSAIVTNQ